MLRFPDYWLVRPLTSTERRDLCPIASDSSDSDVEMQSNLGSIDEDREVTDFVPARTSVNSPLSATSNSHADEPKTPPPRATGLPASTPLHGSLDSFEKNGDGTTADKAVLAYLSELLANKVVRDYPVADFISAVFGITKDDLKRRSAGYSLPEEDCKEYNTGSYLKNSSHERSAYAPLTNIFNDLGDQLKRNVKGHHMNGSDIINMLDRQAFGDFAKFKPDFLTSWIDFKLKQKWKATGTSGELKKKKKVRKDLEGHDYTIDLDRVPEIKYASRPPDGPLAPAAAEEEVQEAEADIPEPEPITSESRKRKAGSTRTPQVRVPKRPRSNTSKQVRSNASGQDGEPQDSPARGNLNASELQAVKYVHELGSHGIRSYAVGFLIEDFTMTLWYIDRMGVVASAPFDFMDEPHFLLLYVASIRYATPTQLGFFSKLGFPCGDVTADRLDTFDEVTLDLSGSADIDSKPLSDLRFVLDVSEDRSINSTHGAIGRATIVVPVLPAVDCETAVTLCGEEKTVAKISWQSKFRAIGEDSLVRVARVKLQASDTLRTHLKHLVDMKCGLTQSMEEMNVPRASMFGLPAEGAKNHRVCRILLMREYIPLRMVDGVDEFKVIFLGVVKGHHAVYETSGILHRDISINNIMFYRDSDGGVVGVLCDWDLAKQLDVSDVDLQLRRAIVDTVKAEISPNAEKTKTIEPSSSSAQRLSATVPFLEVEILEPQEPRYRTGTGPFMSLDLLLYFHVPQHTYRHDLESFFFVLVWFIVTHSAETHTMGFIRGWLQSNLRALGKTKQEFVENKGVYEEVMAVAKGDYKQLERDWVGPIKRLLMKPLKRKYRDIQDQIDDIVALHEAEEKPVEERILLVQADIRDNVHEREFGILTFKSFMACLEPQAEEES
ncbi:hypothetical protein EUX98_g7490 [Antrodiella citrinella]|uniref:Fungal-type protein kinase domain-containing protein n=1 Tax=Antrodiella citrinella TaxID=2447956 RepID=A0A4S4MN33_9APHY|nr:hypothetical protein EUX98_g7490 [Antrodiella citrinella]